MITLSVVVPATDAPATLPASRAALDRAVAALTAAGGTAEVVVVDWPAYLGVCTARNIGALRASGDVVVFVDADVEIHPDALARIAAAFADPTLTALFGSYDDSPSRGGPVAAFRNLLHHHVHQNAGGAAQTFWSGLGAVRRDAFLAAGGFDEERFPVPSVEDIDLGVRLVAGGARIVLDPGIQGTHLKAWTLRSMVVTDFARRGVPWVALQLRHGRARSTALNLGWRHRVSALACLVAVLAVPARRPVAVGAALAVLVGLNRDLYRLLARRRGPGEALLGVGLHAVHHLTAVASVPFGIVSHLRDRRNDG
ncbi:glycosyltransferase [Pseudonocardia sp. DSM 110487]|uniref:glycosyltransferase n=1 Tax=Pseudonocardia sp. DSM 110487 TaxID=2865833 RepID=UPI001C69E381|nr:glycosyltransferase [Pseudonocardia sp. DSM 110487]QYN39117.1 glycosyltransferase [Pseudonocardia sp. DSM 110487]